MSTISTEEGVSAERAALRCLRRAHPDWTQAELATPLGRSLSWVKTWLQRLRAAPPEETQVLWSRSRAQRTPYPRWEDGVVARILEIRDQPPAGLRRVPGPRAILVYWEEGEPAVQDPPPSGQVTVCAAIHRYDRPIEATAPASRA